VKTSDPLRSVGGGLGVTVPAPRSAWRAAFEGDPHAQAFHSPEWVDGVCATGGYENATRLYETPDGRLLVMPMVRRTVVRGAPAYQGSLPPNWGIGGLLSDSPIRPEDIAAVCSDLRRQRGVLRTLIQPAARTGPSWAAAALPGVKPVPRLAHVLDLTGGFDAVWKGFTQTGRRAVRKAERCGLGVQCDTTGALLPQFFELHDQNVKRWAKQQHEPLWLSRLRDRNRDTLPKLEAMAAAVPTSFRLYLASRSGAVIAGIIVWGGTGARCTHSAMIREIAGPARANYLLHRIAIEDACRAGSTHFDFGESGASQELAFFKTRFGARPHPYRQYVVERLPITEVDRSLRTAVKKVLRFREPGPVRESVATDPASSAPGGEGEVPREATSALRAGTTHEPSRPASSSPPQADVRPAPTD
jgi:hypothetical protein